MVEFVKEEGTLQTATHLAARAVVALRAEFRVERVALHEANGIVCNWEQARAAYGDDAKLLRRGFAFIYVGTIVDQKMTEAISEDLRKELNVDMSNALEARETAVRWGLATTVMDTNPFAHVGYNLASRLIRADASLIDQLATKLLEEKILGEDELATWFQANAAPCSLTELEKSLTF